MRGGRGNKVLSQSFTTGCHGHSSQQEEGNKRRWRLRESPVNRPKPASRSVTKSDSGQGQDEAFKCGAEKGKVRHRLERGAHTGRRLIISFFFTALE